MNLPKNTFKPNKKYKRDEITRYFGDMDELDFRGRLNGRPLLVARSGMTTWRFVEDHFGKFRLVEDGQ